MPFPPLCSQQQVLRDDGGKERDEIRKSGAGGTGCSKISLYPSILIHDPLPLPDLPLPPTLGIHSSTEHCLKEVWGLWVLQV